MASPCTPSEGEENLTQSKARLRREKIQARDAVTPALRAEKSAEIVDRILEKEIFRKAEVVMIYRAVRGEVRLDLLPVKAPEKKYVYPLCVENNEMRALLPGSADSWKAGPFRIPEPDPDRSEEISPILSSVPARHLTRSAAAWGWAEAIMTGFCRNAGKRRFSASHLRCSGQRKFPAIYRTGRWTV